MFKSNSIPYKLLLLSQSQKSWYLRNGYFDDIRMYWEHQYSIVFDWKEYNYFSIF